MQKILIIVNSTENIINFRLSLIKKLQNNNLIYISAPDVIYKKEILRLGCKFEKNLISRNSKDLFFEIKTIIQLYKQIRNINPDLIMTYTIKPNIYSGLANIFLKKKIISTVTGLGSSFLKKNILTFFLLKLYKISFLNSYVIFQNNNDRNLFLKEKIVNRGQSKIINGSGIRIPKHYLKNNYNNKIAFLFCSRLIKDKGIREFIAASNKIKILYKNFVKIYIVNFFDKNNISNIDLKDLKLNKNFEILKKTKNLKKYFKKVDCVVLPSYREGLPKTLAEAAAYKKILIATNVPGCKSIVKNNYNGFLCEAKNAESLFKCMKKVVNLNRKQKIYLQNNSRNISRQFDENIINQDYENTIAKKIG